MGDFRVNGEDIVGNGESALPVKQGAWSKVKAFYLQEITVELTPRQQAFEDRMNEVLNQEITFQKFKDFLFQEVKFGK